MYRIVVFGLGIDWRMHSCCLGDNNKIVAFLDNNRKGDQLVNGICVVAPSEISKFEYDLTFTNNKQ